MARIDRRFELSRDAARRHDLDRHRYGIRFAVCRQRGVGEQHVRLSDLRLRRKRHQQFRLQQCGFRNDVAVFAGLPGSFTVSTAFDELLVAVNSVRALAGWSAVTWQNILAPTEPLPSPGNEIRANHLISLRARMNEARQALGMSGVVYSDPDPRYVPVSATHVTELRGAVQ